MFGIHMISLYLMTVALLLLLLVVLVWQKQRTGKGVALWAASAGFGILLGCVAPMAIFSLAGYDVNIAPRLDQAAIAGGGEAPVDVFPPGMGGSPGMGGPGMGSPGMGGPGMGGPGMGMGGPPQPRPKRDLTNLVRKLELLTGDVAITLTGEQAASLCGSLADIEKAETMSDEEAQAKQDEILAVLDEDQKSRLDAISLPRMRPGGAGGPGGPGGPGPGGPGGPGGGGPGGGGEDENANPFQQETNAEAVTSLRERFSAAETPSDTPAPKE